MYCVQTNQYSRSFLEEMEATWYIPKMKWTIQSVMSNKSKNLALWRCRVVPVQISFALLCHHLFPVCHHSPTLLITNPRTYTPWIPLSIARSLWLSLCHTSCLVYFPPSLCTVCFVFFPLHHWKLLCFKFHQPFWFCIPPHTALHMAAVHLGTIIV